MSSTPLYYRPSSPCNWADDDEDDFDFDTWKANTDTSTPTASELGPLQHVLNEVEEKVVFTTEKAPFAEVEVADTDNKPSPTGVDLARNTVLCRALENDSDTPAYPEMSHYSCLTPSPLKRISYTSNWNHFKADSGFDCRRTFLFRSSRLREVISMDDIEDVFETYLEDSELLEQFNEIETEDVLSTASLTDTIDTWERSDSASGDSKEEDAHHVPLPQSKPFSFDNIIAGVITEGSMDDVEFAFTDVFEDECVPDFYDEGYHSASPPVSPTEESISENLKLTSDASITGVNPAVAYMRRDCAVRYDSTDALVIFRKNLAIGDAVIDVFDDDDSAVASSESDPTDLKFDDQVLDFTDFATWPLLWALGDSQNDDNDTHGESQFQKAYDTYLSQPEPSVPEVTKTEINDNNEPSHTPNPISLSVLKSEASKNGLEDDAILSLTPSSAPLCSLRADASSTYVDCPKRSSLYKGILSATITKSRYYISLIPGVAKIVRGAHTKLERMRAYLHQC